MVVFLSAHLIDTVHTVVGKWH